MSLGTSLCDLCQDWRIAVFFGDLRICRSLPPLALYDHRDFAVNPASNVWAAPTDSLVFGPISLADPVKPNVVRQGASLEAAARSSALWASVPGGRSRRGTQSGTVAALCHEAGRDAAIGCRVEATRASTAMPWAR